MESTHNGENRRKTDGLDQAKKPFPATVPLKPFLRVFWSSSESRQLHKNCVNFKSQKCLTHSKVHSQKNVKQKFCSVFAGISLENTCLASSFFGGTAHLKKFSAFIN
jgi:hypothetical protein